MKRAIDTMDLVQWLRARCLDSGSGDEDEAGTDALVHPLGDADRVNPKLTDHMSIWVGLLHLALLEPVPSATLLRWAAGEVHIQLTGATGATPRTIDALVRTVSSCDDPALLRAVTREELARAFPLDSGSTCVGGTPSECPGCRRPGGGVGGVCRGCVDTGALPLSIFHDPGLHWQFAYMQFDLNEPQLGAVALDLVVARSGPSTLTRFFIRHRNAPGVTFDLPAPVHAGRRDVESTIVLRALVQSRAIAATKREAAFRAFQL